MQKQEFGVERMGLEYLNLMRNAFRASMESATLMQDQGERLLGLAVKQSEVGQEEWKKVIQEWADNYKKAREQFQSTVEENLAKLEGFLKKE
jgi:polyhydroxyalkanoate synthesis regulator phasin